MPNENKEWEEDFDKKWFHFADKSVSTTLNQHRWSMKDVVRGYIAEATRRGKVEGLEEALNIVYSYNLKSDKPCHEEDIAKDFYSRIQQYGKQ